MKANLGKSLEVLVELANKQYTAKGDFIGFKVPTAVKVIRRGKQIVSAFFEEKSTVDFIGIYKKVPVAFDCKQTQNKTSFPLKNIKDHQRAFLHSWQQQGGRSFFLIEFTAKNQIFLLGLNQFEAFIQEHDRQSIPLSYFLDHTQQVRPGKGLYLDYLEKAVNGKGGG